MKMKLIKLLFAVTILTGGVLLVRTVMARRGTADEGGIAFNPRERLTRFCDRMIDGMPASFPPKRMIGPLNGFRPCSCTSSGTSVGVIR